MRKLTLIFIALFVVKSCGLDNKKVTDVVVIKKQEIVTKPIIVTAIMYMATTGQCDSTPLITACGRKINPNKASEHKWIAVSRDLLKVFKYGDKVKLSNAGKKNGTYTITDTMNKRFKNKIDILETQGTPLYKLNSVVLTKV